MYDTRAKTARGLTKNAMHWEYSQLLSVAMAQRSRQPTVSRCNHGLRVNKYPDVSGTREVKPKLKRGS